MYDRFEYGRIDHLRSSLDNFIEHGIIPGDFLTGVLEDSISKAVGHADDTSVELIPIISCWLFNEAPLKAWGSPKKVRAWAAARREARSAVA